MLGKRDDARAGISILGSQEAMDTINLALDALGGLPVFALIGGWTFKGLTAYAHSLEEKLALLQANIDSSPNLAEWTALMEDAERYRFGKTLEGQVVVMETLKSRGAEALDRELDEAMAEDAGWAA